MEVVALFVEEGTLCPLLLLISYAVYVNEASGDESM